MATKILNPRGSPGSWMMKNLLMEKTPADYIKSLFTPFNAIAAVILLTGGIVAYLRFTRGLAAVTNLSDANPWGLWIGFDVLCGVALAAGGYVLASAVYLFGMEDYRPVVRPAILTGFLGYFFVVIGLLFDLGRPWRLPYPIFVTVGGVASVMFLVAWHVFLYLTCQFVEFSPAIMEWLGWKKLREWTVKLTVGATVFGVMLSTLHQSALGALFLLAPAKLHPLWYTPLLPWFFFISSIIAGMSMVIMEGMLSHRIFNGQADSDHTSRLERITLGLGKAASLVLFLYFWLKVVGLVHGNHWDLLSTPLGSWFLVEMLGFILAPCFLFLWGVKSKNVALVRFTAVLTVIGIILNRLNVSVIAFNWDISERYVPRWSEIAVTIAIITLGLIAFRWIVNRMPVLKEHPEYPGGH
ncbi:MAG: polysulfide reductase [Dehalococcoidia bacterium]|nr:polysulfide reductase [Dehalococcoidia bacterium]